MSRRRGSRRRRSNRSAELLEGFVAAGAGIGLLLAASGPHRIRHSACPSQENAGTCVGKALNNAVTPYITHGIVGGVLGGLVGIVVLLLIGRIKRSKPAKVGRAPKPKAARSSVTHHSTTTTAPSSPTPSPPRSEELNPQELRVLRARAREAILASLRELGGTGERQVICDRARQIGGFAPKELSAPSVAKGRKRVPRLDYEFSWALTNLKRGGLVENPSRNVWRLTPLANEAPESAVDEPVPDERLQELQLMPYPEYLRTPEWNATRSLALMRAGHRCALDSSHRDGLEVHHNTYERLGAELASDLVVLCRDCHRRHHRPGPAG